MVIASAPGVAKIELKKMKKIQNITKLIKRTYFLEYGGRGKTVSKDFDVLKAAVLRKAEKTDSLGLIICKKSI